GNALLRAWTKRGADVAAATYHCNHTPHFRQLDMQDERSVEKTIEELSPRIIAVPAANPYVDYCELHPEETRKVNVAGSLNVARAGLRHGARMIFYSSDYVFDGRKGVYRENDRTNPVNEYGRQKARVEKEMLDLNPGNLVIRTAGAYGWQWEPKNFVLQVRARLSANQTMKVAADIRYNPTYVENLAEITIELAAQAQGGLFHVVGADNILRYDFAREVAKAFKLDPGLIQKAQSGDFKAPAQRPQESSLNTDKVRALVSTPLQGVRQGLAHMLKFEREWRRYAEKLPSKSK
ncbi:MAG: hypothetical protein A3J74_10770, partial [Elusimicrobia bacterium RIFCSPHIGHO2_02_FULL_57_9]